MRASARKLGEFAPSGLLATEGGARGGYWIGTLPGLPRFYLTTGKLLTGAIVLAGAPLGLLAGRRSLAQASGVTDDPEILRNLRSLGYIQ